MKRECRENRNLCRNCKRMAGKCLPLIPLECKRIRLGNLQPDHNILVHQPGNRMVKHLETKCKTWLICSCDKVYELSNVVGIVHLRSNHIMYQNASRASLYPT